MKNHAAIDTVNFRADKSTPQSPVSAAAVSETWQVIPGSDRDDRPQAPATRLLVCCPEGKGEEVRTYANYLGTLLRSQISFLEGSAKEDIKRINQEVNECNLVIFGEPKQSLLERLLTGCPCHKVVNQLPVSILVARRPRWPIQTVLLIVRVEKTDEAAVDWVGCLARPSGAKVTILPILYSSPSVYAPVSSEETALGELLSPNTQPGRQLRCLSQRLARWQIEATLRFRQGEPEWQIHWEVTEGNYDLVVIGAEPYDSWQGLLMGKLVTPMLGWLDRPLLIARPGQAAQSTVGDGEHD